MFKIFNTFINKNDQGGQGLWKHLRFHWYRGEGHRLRYLWNRVRWHIYPRFGCAGKYPDHVDLELSSACNMKCPMCYTTTDEFKNKVPLKNMSFELYCKVVDELAKAGVFSIRLSWRGEPTLNKHFMECIRYARKKGIHHVATLTNALRLTPEMFEEMVDLKMDWLTISFDGTGKTYEEIRYPAKYDEMLEKIREFRRIRDRKKSNKPVIRIQGIWSAIEDNPNEYYEAFEPIADEISVNTILDYLNNDTDYPLVESFSCAVPLQRLFVTSDGRCAMCVNDEMGKVIVGDANKQTIQEIWNGPVLSKVREHHRNQTATDRLAPCKRCHYPRQTKQAPIEFGGRTIYLDELVGRAQEVGK